MARSRAVLLDLWHTLEYLPPEAEERYMSEQLDTMARVVASWPRSPRARHPSLQDPRRAVAEAQAEAAAAARRGISMPISVQGIHAARRLGRRARPLELVQAIVELLDHTVFELVPGAADALSALRAAGFRLGVISNTVGEPGEALQRHLERVGIGQYVDAWAFSDQLPWTKPAPEIFWHCLAMLGVSKDRAIHVGDGWSDLVGARAAGLRAGVLFTGAQDYGERYRQVFAPPAPELDSADYRIQALSELPSLADRLLPA